MIRQGGVGMKQKVFAALLLALAVAPFTGASAAGGMPSYLAEAGLTSEYMYSSAISVEPSAMHDETTLYFNDGFGRLIEFHLTTDHQTTELSIRQNGCEVWRGHLPGAGRFSVVREESMGEVYFLISAGEKEYRARIDRDDRWSVSERKRKIVQDTSPLPV